MRGIESIRTKAVADTAFDSIVAAWDENELCCQSRQSPKGCGNHPRWLAVDSHHACYDDPHTILMCSFHRSRWVRLMQELIDRRGYYECRCGARFSTSSQFMTFRAV